MASLYYRGVHHTEPSSPAPIPAPIPAFVPADLMAGASSFACIWVDKEIAVGYRREQGTPVTLHSPSYAVMGPCLEPLHDVLVLLKGEVGGSFVVVVV